MQDRQIESGDIAAKLRGMLKAQFHGALAMLREAIEVCPEELWAEERPNPFWRNAYHAIFFTHLYLQPTLDDFRPWEKHQTHIQYLDDTGAPEAVNEKVELPHRPPKTGKPYTKEEILEYWAICDGMVDEMLERTDLSSPESGFFWYKLSKLEHQMINLRHVQHHLAQLSDRLRGQANIGIKWVGAKRR
jgi:hypothetical protein